MNDKRRLKRLFVFCRLLDMNQNFLGYALDLTKEGIRMMVQSSFPNEEKFDMIIRSPDRSNPVDITITVDKVWRKAKSEQFDEVGGKIEKTNDDTNFDRLIVYFNQVSQMYSVELD